MEKLNVHFYDGQLRERYDTVKHNFQGVETVPVREKMQKYHELWNRLITKCSVSLAAKKVWDTLLQDIPRGRDYPKNYDAINRIYVEDILYMCCIISELYDPDIDFYQVLAVQLEEMQMGMCSQGRACRLLQVVLSYS